nr:serine/arginine-rich splicing factor 12-like [Dermatophagoides farinae]
MSHHHHHHHRYDYSSAPKPNRSLFIKRVPFQTRSHDLREIFEKYGPVKDVYIPKDFYTGKIRGFAYVEFERLKDAEYAIRKLKYDRLWGNELCAEFAQGDRKTPTQMRKRNNYSTTSYGQRSPISNEYYSRKEGNYHRRNRSRSPSSSHNSHRYHHQKRQSFSRSRSRSPYNNKKYRPTSPKPSYDPRLFLD